MRISAQPHAPHGFPMVDLRRSLDFLLMFWIIAVRRLSRYRAYWTHCLNHSVLQTLKFKYVVSKA